MSTSTEQRRRRAQRLACTGVGTVAALVGIASPAVAADGLVVKLAPSEVVLMTFPVENFGGDLDAITDPDFDPSGMSGPVRVPVQYSGQITVDIPDELDASTAGVELVFDDNQDGTPEATYSSRFASANPKKLAIVASAGSVTVTLPADDPIAGDAARLTVGPVTTTLGPAFTAEYDQIEYEIGFDAAAPAAQTVAPALFATSQIPCGLSEGPCPLPTPVRPGSKVTLALSQDSVLRELGLADLTGVQVALASMDEDGYETGQVVPVKVTVNKSRASFVLPKDIDPGAYGLFVGQDTPSGGFSAVIAELTVEAAPVAEPAPAAPKPNAGLRSNTGVHLPAISAPDEVTDGIDGIALTAGAGMLLLAGAGAAVVARSRRRPAAEGGTCGV